MRLGPHDIEWYVLQSVEAIHAAGKALAIKTIAEFVETQATLDMLCLMGIDYAQGNFLGRPEPLTHLAGHRIKVMPR